MFFFFYSLDDRCDGREGHFYIFWLASQNEISLKKRYLQYIDAANFVHIIFTSGYTGV